MTDTDAELTFGTLDFLADPFYAVAGFDTGAPEPLVTVVQRLLLDGELVTHERDGNRGLTFRLEVTGNDVLDLNEAEADLIREVNKPQNELRWKPPGLNTPVTVFDTYAGFVSQVVGDLSDLEEMKGKRYYTVTLPASPHGRSADLVTTPHVGTTKQELVSLATGGSIRTPGTLEVFNSGAALDRLLVFTCEDLGDGYRPDVGRYYLAGTRASNADNMSGYEHSSGASFAFPNDELAPGPYAAFIRHTASEGAQISARFQTYVGVTAVGDYTDVTARSTGDYDADSYVIQPLGIVHLPSVASAAEASTATTRITLTLPDVQLADEVWLFRLDGQSTWIDAAFKYVWLESPTPDLPYGAVWMGNNADKSDAVHPGSALKAFGRHVFEAPEASVFVAATSVPSLNLSRYHRWHSNAAD